MWIGLTIIGVVLLIAGGAVWFIFFNESGSNAHEENIAIVEGDTPPQVPSPVVERSKETESAPAPKIIPLESELPQVVFDEFHDDWYDRCDSPQQSELKIVRSWTGVGPGEIDITPPADSYFLVVRGSPSAATWSFEGSYYTSRLTHDLLTLTSDVPDNTADAQQWCISGFGRAQTDRLEIESFGISWIVDLTAPKDGMPLADDQIDALSGYFSLCPPRPPEELLRVLGRWTSTDIGDFGQVSFQTSVPFNYLIAEAVPIDPKRPWDFNSLETQGEWRNLGPKLSSQTDGLIDSTALCPSASERHRLNIESNGVDWTLWQIGVPR